MKTLSCVLIALFATACLAEDEWTGSDELEGPGAFDGAEGAPRDTLVGMVTDFGSIAPGQSTIVTTSLLAPWSMLSFTASQGVTYTVTVSSANADPVTWLVSSTDEFLAYSDDDGATTSSKIVYKVPNGASGRLRILVRDYFKRAGTYQVTLTVPYYQPPRGY